jgi:hypothetical protein
VDRKALRQPCNLRRSWQTLQAVYIRHGLQGIVGRVLRNLFVTSTSKSSQRETLTVITLRQDSRQSVLLTFDRLKPVVSQYKDSLHLWASLKKDLWFSEAGEKSRP